MKGYCETGRRVSQAHCSRQVRISSDDICGYRGHDPPQVGWSAAACSLSCSEHQLLQFDSHAWTVVVQPEQVSVKRLPFSTSCVSTVALCCRKLQHWSWIAVMQSA